MIVIEIVAILIGAIFVINLIVTALGGLNPGKTRRVLNGVANLGVKVCRPLRGLRGFEET